MKRIHSTKNNEESNKEKNEYILAGFMIARASLGNPWCFLPDNYTPIWTERISIMREHMDAMIKTKGEQRSCLEIRKHFVHYLHGFDGVREYRKRLASLTSLHEAEVILDELSKIIDISRSE